MGCGSSTTSVQVIKSPDHDRSRNGSAKHDRRIHSAKSKSSRSPSYRSPDKRPSSSSSSSSAESRDKKRKRKTKVSENEKITSAGSRRSVRSDKQRTEHTEIIKFDNDENEQKEERHNERIISAGSRRSVSNGIQRNDHTEIIKFDNDENEQTVETHKEKETDNTLDKNNKTTETDNGGVFLTDLKDIRDTGLIQNKQEQHETVAKTKEERRSKMNLDELEDKLISDMQLVPLDISQKEEEQTNKTYTIDDIVEHNNEVGKRDWFIYARKVYSVDKLIPVVKERMALFIERLIVNCKEDGFGPLYYREELMGISADEDETMIEQTKSTTIEKITTFKNANYPIYVARAYGVTRKDLKKVLSLCFIGNVVEIEHYEMIRRQKQSVENTIEELDKDTGEYITDAKEQLNRWLQEYPNVQTKNEPPKTGKDPNEQTFPLPQAILFDPLILRKWIEDRELFETEITGDVWNVTELLNEDIGDCNEEFAKIVKNRIDESIPDFDMTIEGEAAWDVIEIGILKNDKTTEEQERIWALREKRTNLNDPEWMEKRRAHIGDLFVARHEMDPNIMAPFLSFAENLERSWNEFLELCEKDFVPPKRIASGNKKGNDSGKRRKSVESNTGNDNKNKNGDENGQIFESIDNTNENKNNDQLVVTETTVEINDDQDEKCTFMTSTNVIDWENDTDNLDNNLLNLDNDPNHPDTNVLCMEDDKPDPDHNVLKIEDENLGPGNNVLKLEEKKAESENNMLKLDRENSIDKGDRMEIESRVSREKSGTSTGSSKSSSKSPGMETMDSGLDLDHPGHSDLTANNTRDSHPNGDQNNEYDFDKFE